MRIVPLIASFLFAAGTAAADYPAKSVRVIVPAPAGGNADAVARTVFEPVASKLGQAFVIDNRPGAGGNIGTDMAVRQPADGYTLGGVITANPINATMSRGLNFELTKDFTPVALTAEMPLILVVHPILPAKNVQEL